MEKGVITLEMDYETSSRADLKHGLDVYARHPSTKVLMLAYQIDMGDGLGPSPVRVWLPHREPMPTKLAEMIQDPNVLRVAHNMAFERAITNHVLMMDMPIENSICTMVMALSLGLPAKLETLVRDALKLERKYWKDSAGDALIRLFCYPNHKATWESHPEEFARFVEYCRQDVVAEAKVFSVLKRYVHDPKTLFRQWAIDQRINARGIPVDIDFIDSAKHLSDVVKARYKAEMQEFTGLANPNSTQQVLPWLTERGYPFASLAKNRVQIAVRDHGDDMTEEARQFIDMRLESNKSSLAKYDAIKRSSVRGRLRNVFQFRGAAATGRYAGRVLGQNIPRPAKFVEEHLAEVRDLIMARDLDTIDWLYGKPLEVLASSIRSAIAAPKGKKLVVADLASIETCVIAWWTNCRFWLDTIESGQDAYKAFGSRWLEKPYDEITKFERNLSKPPTLGCFGADTEILTERGWIPIVDVRLDDRVFDGVEFVQHDGVVDQGVKQVIDAFGVTVTPDHLVMCGEDEWREIGSVSASESSSRRALAWATGLCSASSALSQEAPKPGTIAVSVNTAGPSTWSTATTSRQANRLAAFSVRRLFGMSADGLSTGASASTANTPSDCPTASTPCARGVSGEHDPTLRTPVEGSNVGSRARRILSSTPSLFRAGTTLGSRQTASTTTATTSPATSVSSQGPSTSATNAPMSSLSIRASAWWSRISTNASALAIATSRLLRGSSNREKAPSKSSQTRRFVEANTYDVLNAGPRNRFVIRTDRGPLIVHNCGFRMGPGREVGEYPDVEKTGLWGYAANMGVQMSKEECKAAVKVYRDLSPEIVQAWYDLDRASMECVLTGEPQRAGMLTFDYKKPFLRMRLPSGRYIHYCRPRIELVTMEWENEDGEIVREQKQGLTYERLSQSGKWVRISQHGGRFAEQATQGIAYDLLQAGIENAEAAHLNPVAHFHDEIICELPEDEDALDLLIECMTSPPKWAEGLPLRAEGYEAKFYRK